VRSLLLLFGKDLRLLARSPVQIAALIAYPVVVAALVALALQGGGQQPTVAVVNLDDPGRTVRVGEERFSVDDYVARLDEEVDVVELDPDEAQDALADGRVSAILTIPDGFIGNLQSGFTPPTIELETSRRDPIEAEEIARRLEAAVFRFNQALAADYVAQVLQLVDLVVDGGTIGVFGRTGVALGLDSTREIIVGVQASLRAQGDDALADELDPLLLFVEQTEGNLSLARPAATALASPIELEIVESGDGREPLSALGVAAALLVSLGLAGVLLAAAGIAGEREEHVLSRLRRGLVSPTSITIEKILFATGATLVIGLALLAVVAGASSLAVGRWGLWVAALLVTGLGFAAFGALIGAAARETRGALLAALMLALPLLFVGLIPGDIAGGIAAVVPFGPALSAFQSLLAEPSVPTSFAVDLGHSLGLAIAFGSAAALVLWRRPQ
jgi:ABC-type transport system involved in cytochrome c biogenesis permease component